MVAEARCSSEEVKIKADALPGEMSWTDSIALWTV